MKADSKFKYYFAAVGVGLLLGAAYLFKNTQDFLADAVFAKGQVVDVERSLASRSRAKAKTPNYHPIIRFTTEVGSPIEFKSSSGSNKPIYKKGDAVDVLYRPSAPNSTRVSGFMSLWGAPMILGLLGVLFSALGLTPIIRGHR